MNLKPTSRKRGPYIFHFEGQTVALGEPRYLHRINERLIEQGYRTRPTYWDQAYLADLSMTNPENFSVAAEQFDLPSQPDQLNSVGVDCTSSEFWSAMYARAFNAASWGAESDDTLYMPQLPDWLERSRAWSIDPLAPYEGDGEPDPIGGWVRVRETPGSNQPLGLFQLTSNTSFWVFGSAPDLKQVVRLCRELARERTGFDRMVAYMGYDLTCSSICLPIECRRPLEEELFLAGVDAETLFWDKS